MNSSSNLLDLALKDRVILVTGAASGIGQAVAGALVSAGVMVGALDRHRDGIPTGCIPLTADIRHQAEVTKAIDTFAGANGRLDGLVHSAAISYTGSIEEGEESEWQNLFDVNVFGQIRVLRAALPWLRRAEQASVVILSSCSVQNGIPQRALYSASKGAVHAMAMAVAADLVDEGIRVNCIVPGTVDTPFMRELIARAPDPAAQRRAYEVRQPTGRMVDRDEVARAAAYLLSPLSSSTTGSALVVDGGMQTLRTSPQQP